MNNKDLQHSELVREFLRESNAIEDVWDDQSYEDAFEAWLYVSMEGVLTDAVIKKTHKILMQHQPLEEKDKGNYRKCEVMIAGRLGVPWQLLGVEMWKWGFETMRKSPPPDWKELHVAYEKIHPFVDGNGRTGRIFMNWTRVKRCGLPILVIKESEKWEYYKWFD